MQFRNTEMRFNLNEKQVGDSSSTHNDNLLINNKLSKQFKKNK
jgi:hypothetical protein